MSQENVEIVRLIYASLTRGGDGVIDLVGARFCGRLLTTAHRSVRNQRPST
jgi:hypothetical protein